MEKVKRKRASTRGIEENTMAILESFCSYDSSHVHDDRLAFLDAVRSSSIVSENGSPPTNKMMGAIFGIMREENSLELIIASYRLLCELEKHYPRVCLSNQDDEQGFPSKSAELVIFEEAWSPFSVGSDGGLSDKHAIDKGPKEPINAADFHLLIAGVTEVIDESESSQKKLELLSHMVLLQYLITILEADFLPRNRAFLDNSNWIPLRESILNKLLGSRSINYKGFVKDCLYLLSNSFTGMDHDSDPAESTSSNSDSIDLVLALSLPEMEKHKCEAVQKLLILMIELDSSKKIADLKSLTTRLDGVRTPVVDLIVDELSYNKDMISPYLQGFNAPKLKLEIVSQYLQKYTSKPSTRNRRSSSSQDEAVVDGILKCFLNSNSTKGIVKKLGVEAVQVLLAHTLQACMSINKEQLEEMCGSKEDATGSPLIKVCEDVISAFTKLKETDEHLEILPIGKEALFAAATVLSVR